PPLSLPYTTLSLSPRRTFHYPPQNVRRHAVFPYRAGLVDERRFRHGRHLVLGAHITRIEFPLPRLVYPRRVIGFLHFFIGGNFAIRQAGGMPEKVMACNGLLGWHLLVA